MYIDTAKALLPVQVGILPVEATLHQGIGNYRHHDYPGRGMRFVGFGAREADTRYGPSGKVIEKQKVRGALVDIYV